MTRVKAWSRIRPVRILHIGKYYPPHAGGMETALRNITEGLLDRDCDVSVLVSDLDNPDRVELVHGPESGRSWYENAPASASELGDDQVHTVFRTQVEGIAAYLGHVADLLDNERGIGRGVDHQSVALAVGDDQRSRIGSRNAHAFRWRQYRCLLYTSDAADDN